MLLCVRFPSLLSPFHGDRLHKLTVNISNINVVTKIKHIIRDQPNSREKMHDFTAEF